MKPLEKLKEGKCVKLSGVAQQYAFNLYFRYVMFQPETEKRIIKGEVER